ncbi:PREDICTED: uncharacterized protein LOC109132671 [Camelina sativa]|uniref:Uncharacterized protein LOC109132671 n=1 Tax=Camelina sativa TaxID=90675 RepID=A0ABM1RMC6_CAMSA|nr:PREDICTED: uncharacterized protein LOC109132671 [Camelina sativa]
MRKEVDALEITKTWVLTHLPPGKHVIGSQWVFRIKYRADGNIERYKARLVALGNKQIEGVDYKDTFSPVIKMTTVRAFLGVASVRGWELHQMDVHNAFLHGDLDEEVYMTPPPGFRTDDKTLVCRLKKSLVCRREGLFLSQRKHALDIISEAGLLGSKPADSPMEQQHNLAMSKSALLADPQRYRRLVGRLIYLAATRPDLAYSVHILTQFMQQPRVDHWTAALRVVHYLKGNAGQGIFLNSDCDLKLHGWCDSDYAGCRLTRCSLSGWFITLGTSPIS